MIELQLYSCMHSGHMVQTSERYYPCSGVTGITKGDRSHGVQAMHGNVDCRKRGYEVPGMVLLQAYQYANSLLSGITLEVGGGRAAAAAARRAGRRARGGAARPDLARDPAQ
jgi:hypothetical protein